MCEHKLLAGFWTHKAKIYNLYAEQPRHRLIKNDKLDIQGDLKIAQRFAHVAESLDIDWQSELAKRIGDIPTYKLGQLGKKLLKKLSFATKQIKADASEWLVHEKRLLVTEAEMSYFNLDVIQVEQKVAALSQRIDALINQQSKLS